MKNTKLEICRKCWGTGHINGGDETSAWSKTCEDCRGIGFIRVPMTNADRIRAMTDEELAKYIDDVASECWNAGYDGACLSGDNPLRSTETLLEWLQQPAEGE